MGCLVSGVTTGSKLGSGGDSICTALSYTNVCRKRICFMVCKLNLKLLGKKALGTVLCHWTSHLIDVKYKTP